MKDSPIVDIIDQLYKSRDIIAEAYHSRTIEYEDNDKIQGLIQTRLAIKTGSDKLRLSRQLVKFLDYAILKDKIVRINNNLGGQIDALRMHCLSAQDENINSDARAQQFEYFEDGILEIEDELESMIVELCTRIERGFALSTSWKQRKRENEYYLNEISKLIEGLYATRKELSGEPFNDEEFFVSKITNLIIKFIGFHSRIQQAQKTISEFLFKQRVLSEKHQKIAAVSAYLKDNPLFTPYKIEAEQHPYFTSIEGIRFNAYADIANKSIEADLTEIVISVQQSISQENLLEPKERVDSEIDTFETASESDSISWVERSMNHLVDYALDGQKTVSVSEYWEQFKYDQSIFVNFISNETWIWFVISFFDASDRTVLSGELLSEQVDLSIELSQDEIFNGNQYITDVYIKPLLETT